RAWMRTMLPGTRPVLPPAAHTLWRVETGGPEGPLLWAAPFPACQLLTPVPKGPQCFPTTSNQMHKSLISRVISHRHFEVKPKVLVRVSALHRLMARSNYMYASGPVPC